MRRRALYYTKVGERTYQGDGIGKPLITEDADGKIISWVGTESMDFTGSNYIDTRVCLTYAEGFELHIAGSFPSTPNNQDTILNCMNEGDDNYPGFCLRWSSSASCTKLYYGSKSNAMTKANILSFDITLTKDINSSKTSLITVWSSGSNMESSYTIPFDNSVSLFVGSSESSTGAAQRYATCTITDFYVKII